MAELASGVSLTFARYGKDNIRVYKRHRNEDGSQDVAEFTVCTMLEGDIETSYTEADNSVVVPTDTQKQTVYILAKQIEKIEPAEVFAATIGQHFLDKYEHIHVAHVKITQHRWTRMAVDGKPHPHSFVRDSNEVRTVEVAARRQKVGAGATTIHVKSGIDKLHVLKSTGSAFHSFIQDKYTILRETDDRILSTDIQCAWAWAPFSGVKDVIAHQEDFDKAFNKAREITLTTFANENSPSVQNTMYKMCEQIIAAVPRVDSVDYSLPNKHYFEIDLSWFEGLENTGSNAEVYAPQTDPNGLIQCTVSRNKAN